MASVAFKLARNRTKMKKILVALLSITVAMTTEILLHSSVDAEDLEIAKEDALKAAVELGVAAASQLEVPSYLVPLKAMLMNETVLRQLAKLAYDGAVHQLKELLVSLTPEALLVLQSDISK